MTATGGDPTRITVLIVDDHSMVAESFRRALALEDDLEVVAVAATAADARAAATAHRPDVVLMDYALPDGDGVTTAAALVRERPATKVILVTGSDAADAVRRALEAGCVGYLEKTMALSQLAVAIRAAAAGETAISPEHLALALRPPPVDEAQLTPREREILRLVADRPVEPGHRRPAGPQPAHGAHPRAVDPGQAGRALQARGGQPSPGTTALVRR